MYILEKMNNFGSFLPKGKKLPAKNAVGVFKCKVQSAKLGRLFALWQKATY
jgi:hypothetical protein